MVPIKITSLPIVPDAEIKTSQLWGMHIAFVFFKYSLLIYESDSFPEGFLFYKMELHLLSSGLSLP